MSKNDDRKKRGSLPNALIAFGGVMVVALIVLVVVCLSTHPFNSPLHHQYGQALHALIWLAAGTPVSDEWDSYTGVVRYWNATGVLDRREQYKRGEREGVWVEYNEDGSIDRLCEYRDGSPWNGVCNIHHMKAWIAEYREGQPWNGVTWRYDRDVKGSVDQFWVDGHEVTEAEYKAAPGFTDTQYRQPIGVIAPID